MGDHALGEIDAGIIRLEAELEALRLTRAVLARLAPDAGRKPKQLLPAPPGQARGQALRKKRRKKTKRVREPSVEQGLYEVNGRDIKVSERQLAVLELLNEAPEGECIPFDRLLPLYDNKKALFYAEMQQLKKKLRPAKSTIGNVRGQGCRLELMA